MLKKLKTSVFCLLAGAGIMLCSCNKDNTVAPAPEPGPPGEEGEAPVVTFSYPEDGITLGLGDSFTFYPKIAISSNYSYTVIWKLNGNIVDTSPESYTFTPDKTGEYTVEMTAFNDYGSSTARVRVTVLEALPYTFEFPRLSYFGESNTRYTFPGRAVYLTPVIMNYTATRLKWEVNGVAADENRITYRFVPKTPGKYTITVTANEEITASVDVVCVDKTEEEMMRKGAPGNARVLEYCPAPGQFIGEYTSAGITSHTEAIKWAQESLDRSEFVSLGGFGGYIIVGFSNSIPASGNGYDFGIESNAFLNDQSGNGGSNEPGIVYVMQDVNGNGLPDDEWFELRGSESDNSETLKGYTVTYYRPTSPKSDVLWRDNLGRNGSVDYVEQFHKQDYYYPAWITADSYTLTGTCLPARTSVDEKTGYWNNSPFPWGYADNIGSDIIEKENAPKQTGFRILNAINPDNSPAELRYIDFIKVQTGVNSKAGILGEVSTEVLHFNAPVQ